MSAIIRPFERYSALLQPSVSFLALLFWGMCGGASFADDLKPVAPAFSLGFARAKSVTEADGKITGAWATSGHQACGENNPVSTFETATLVQLTANIRCQNGEVVYTAMHRSQPKPADGSCVFDYVTVSGMIPVFFQDTTARVRAAPEMLAVAKAALPNFQHVYGTQQAGGMAALIGWSPAPPNVSSEDLKKNMVALVEQKKRAAGEANYRFDAAQDDPFALYITQDYVDGGVQRRDAGFDAIVGAKCIYSAKFTAKRQSDDDANWQAVRAEFDRMRRVIKNHEAGLPWAVDGVK